MELAFGNRPGEQQIGGRRDASHAAENTGVMLNFAYYEVFP